MVSADLKVQNPVAMVRNNRPRLWIKKVWLALQWAILHIVLQTLDKVSNPSVWKKKGYLGLVSTLTCIIRVKRSNCLLSCLLLNSFDSHLWALRPLHTVGREYPAAGAQLQHPPLHTAELQHDKESKKTALSTAPLHRLKVLIYLPSWHSCSLIGCFKQTRRNMMSFWSVRMIDFSLYIHAPSHFHALFPSSVLILVYPKKAQSFPLWSSKPDNK